MVNASCDLRNPALESKPIEIKKKTNLSPFEFLGVVFGGHLVGSFFSGASRWCLVGWWWGSYTMGGQSQWRRLQTRQRLQARRARSWLRPSSVVAEWFLLLSGLLRAFKPGDGGAAGCAVGSCISLRRLSSRDNVCLYAWA